MPKVIELTVELDVQRVSCPGVWLCQDGRVSLTVFALGTSYQTCLMHPIFPLMFKDVFYFRKRFHETCSLNNICCLLKDETIYCELVQWCEDCQSGGATILAQYLGTLNDVLFPPNMCSNEGVDLLMRRSKDFPGILSPKIEITTKVRIDEVWNTGSCLLSKPPKVKACDCDREIEGLRQKQVCHTPLYHRVRCTKRTRSRSRSRSSGSRSLCSLGKEPDASCEYRRAKESADFRDDGRLEKIILESNYIDQEHTINHNQKDFKKYHTLKISPCVCEICKRYHQLFHGNCTKS